LIRFSHNDQKAQPWGGPKADFSEAFRPTGNGGARAEPPLTIILIKKSPYCPPAFGYISKR
jgi:hypothetical protein